MKSIINNLMLMWENVKTKRIAKIKISHKLSAEFVLLKPWQKLFVLLSLYIIYMLVSYELIGIMNNIAYADESDDLDINEEEKKAKELNRHYNIVIIGGIGFLVILWLIFWFMNTAPVDKATLKEIASLVKKSEKVFNEVEIRTPAINDGIAIVKYNLESLTHLQPTDTKDEIIEGIKATKRELVNIRHLNAETVTKVYGGKNK